MKQTPDDGQHPRVSRETSLASCEISESGLTWCQDLLVEMERIMDGNLSTYDSHATTESEENDASKEEDVVRQNIMVALNEVFYTMENGSSNSSGGSGSGGSGSGGGDCGGGSGGSGGEGWIEVDDDNNDETNISYGDEVLDLEEEESDDGELDYAGLMVGVGKEGENGDNSDKKADENTSLDLLGA